MRRRQLRSLSLPQNLHFDTKTGYVLDSLRTAILVGDILPGSRITEQQIRDALNVSSSPVREAFHQLEAEGLLTRNPHVGTTVTSMDIEDAKELYRIQSVLQGSAVQICTKKLKEEDIREAERLNKEMRRSVGKKNGPKRLRVANYKLHMLLCGINVYPWLTRLISGLWILFPTHSYWVLPNRPMVSIQQHEEVIEAVKQRNEVQAGSLMRKHLESSMQALYGNRST